ncbi:hypothetical protein LIER_03721 [Lithospermum erythrorhizon]|uniref:Uncharacterized protein n=1 Tax=Lithospermum erythrorhizon TaxID=34254 RepID=A0AAV3NU63_LITER
MEKEFELSIFNSNQYVGGSNDIVEAKSKERQLFSYVSDSNVDDMEIKPKRLLIRRSYSIEGGSSSLSRPTIEANITIPVIEAHPKKLRRHIEIDLNKIPKEDEEEDQVREAAIRHRLDLNKHPIDIGELNSNLEFEDVIVSMLKIYYPLFY